MTPLYNIVIRVGVPTVVLQVENIRADRDTLRSEIATLEDKLSDVERFRESERGQILEKMEQELAAEKMARVELEADRDDLQSQLAAALGNSRRAKAPNR